MSPLKSHDRPDLQVVTPKPATDVLDLPTDGQELYDIRIAPYLGMSRVMML